MYIVSHGGYHYHASSRKDLSGLVEEISSRVNQDGFKYSLEKIISDSFFAEINTNKKRVGLIKPEQPLSDLLTVKVGLLPLETSA